MRKSFACATSALLILSITSHANVIINEFVAKPGPDGLQDADCQTVDWIELHNPSSEPIDLSGYFLSDNLSELTQWAFPSPTSIAGGDYLVVFASGKDRSESANQLHTNFQLDAESDDLVLTRADGTTILSSFSWADDDERPEGVLRAQRGGTSYGRDPESAQEVFLSAPTPGARNAGAQIELEKVRFSHESQTFTKRLTIEISPPVEGATIRYSDNGMIPNLFGGKDYNGPIEIDDSTIIRARWQHPETGAGSILSSRHYIKLAETAIPDERAAGVDLISEFESALPVVVVETFGAASENVRDFVPVVINLFEPVDGTTTLTSMPTVSTRAVYRLRGKSSLQFPKKQYRIELRNQQDTDKDLSLLDLPADSDWILNAPWVDKSFIRNSLVYELGRDIGMLAPRTRLVEAFINEDGGALRYDEDYRGVYVLTETLKLGDERIDIERLAPCHDEEPEISGGYVVRFDKVDGPTIPGFGNFQASIPDHDEITEAQETWISDYVTEFRDRTRGANFADPELGYRAVADEQSMINLLLINEFTKEQDTYIFSHYLHKDRNGLLKFGPLWDYNLSFGTGISTTGTEFWNFGSRNSQLGWEGRIFQRDLEFHQGFIDDWTSLRRSHLAEDAWNARIDRHAALLLDNPEKGTGPATRNFAVWDSLGERNLNEFVSPVSETYEEQIQFLKDWSKDRFKWIDGQFLDAPRFEINDDQLTLVGGSLFQRRTIYYTLDGTDPRLPGGDPSSTASIYEGPVTLTESVLLTMRNWFDDEWSGKIVERLVVGEALADASNLLLTEIMFRPAQASEAEEAAGWSNRDDFEFLELHNLGDQSLSLAHLTFTDGIRYTPAQALELSLPPGGHGVLVKNLEAFRLRYGDSPLVLGVYDGRLSNGGERLTIQGAAGEELLTVAYEDNWYRETDGAGRSLVLATSEAPVNWSLQGSWIPGSIDHGTPGSGEVSSPPTPPWNPAIFIEREQGDPRITVESHGETYQLQVSEDLIDWRPLVTTEIKTHSDSSAASEPKRFYRATRDSPRAK